MAGIDPTSNASGINPSTEINVKTDSPSTGISMKPQRAIRRPEATPSGEEPAPSGLAPTAPKLSRVEGMASTDYILNEIINSPDGLSETQFRNYPEKIIGNLLYYQKITLDDLRALQNQVNDIPNSIHRRKTQDTIDKYLNSSTIFGRPRSEYESKNEELGKEREEDMEDFLGQVEEENKTFEETAKAREMERLEKFESQDMPLDEYITQLDRRSGQLNKSQALKEYLLRQMFPDAEQGDLRRVATGGIEKLPPIYNDLFNSAWSALMAMVKKDAGRLADTASRLARGETPQGFEAETAGIASVEDISTISGMLAGVLTGDERLKNQQFYDFVLQRIENLVNLEDFSKTYGDVNVRELNQVLPLVLSGEASAGVIKGLIKQMAKKAGGKVAEEAGGGLSGAGAGAVVGELGEVVGEGARDITSELLREQLDKEGKEEKERQARRNIQIERATRGRRF